MSTSEQWKIVMKTPMGKMPVDLDIIVTGTEFSGTVTGQGHTNPISGNVKDGVMTFPLKIKIMPMTMDFTGQIDGDTIEGDVKAGFMGSFPFSGERVQA